jgi:hypothetical protein
MRPWPPTTQRSVAMGPETFPSRRRASCRWSILRRPRAGEGRPHEHRLLAGGLLWLAQLPADGSYLSDLLLPSLVVGLGEGVIWVASMVAATSGADESEAGLASGLVNTSQQLGGALGDAALVAVATSRETLTDGFSAGFTVGAGIAALATLLAATLLSPTRTGSRDESTPGRRDRPAEAAA